MICTFYSYKGGVGRSMAVANVAELLYSRGLKVLMVDFDLEAPGLERFFDTPEVQCKPTEIFQRRGIIDMLLSYKELRSLPRLSPPQRDTSQSSESFEFPFAIEPLSNFIVPIYKESSNGGLLSLIPAGRRGKDAFAQYAAQVHAFDWTDFYMNWDGELFFEWFRHESELCADVILIDSRTGVTEMSGVCSYQLADVVIMFVASNQQNLDGTLKMAKSLSKPSLISEGRKGRALSLLFVPSRVEINEKVLHDNFELEFNTSLKEFASLKYKDKQNIFKDFRIPYIPYYAYGEKVAVREAGPSSPSAMVQAFEKLSSTLAHLAPSTNPLFQIYQAEQSQPITVDISPIADYTDLIASSTRDFTGREWIFEAVSNWLSDAKGSRFFILSGDPGSGKTAIASRLVQFSYGNVAASPGSRLLAPGFLSAIHFCSAQDTRTVAPNVFVEALITQLASQYPAYVENLVEKGNDRQVRVVAEQRVLAVPSGQVTSLVIKNVSVGDGPMENAFNRFIREPLEALFQEAPQQDVVILIDGLNEVSSGEQSILSLLCQADYRRTNARFIVTTRPEPDILRQLRRFGYTEYSLTSGEGLTHSLDDVKRYVFQLSSSTPTFSSKLVPGFTLDVFATTVQERSKGNMLYVHFLLEALKSQTVISRQSLDVFPEGMGDAYVQLLERFVGNDQKAWTEKYAPLLGVLVIAYEPLTRDQLAGYCKMDKTEVHQITKLLRRFLVVDDALPASQRTYSIFHPSFAAFLLNADQAEEYWCDAIEQHKRIVDYYRGAAVSWDEVDWKRVDDYGMRYLTAHLQALVQVGVYREAFYDLVCKSFMRESYTRYGSHQRFAMYVSSTMKKACSEATLNLVPVVRGSLIYATLGEFATNVPLDALAALVHIGQLKRALDVASLIQNANRRNQAYRLIDTLPVQKGIEVAKREIALEEASNEEWQPSLPIAAKGDTNDSTVVLSEIAQALVQAEGRGDKSTLVAQSLAKAEMIENIQWRSFVLREIVQSLAMLEQYDRALTVTGMISDQKDKAIGLSLIAMALAEKGQSERAVKVVDEALIAGEVVGHSYQKAFALRQGAQALSLVGEEHAGIVATQALAAQAAISYEYQKMFILRDVIHALAQQGSFDQALATAEAIGHNMYKVAALIEVAQALVQAGEFERATTVSDRAKALASADGSIEINASEVTLPLPELCDAFLNASSLGRENVFEVLKRSVPTLAAIDQGQTLWRVYEVVLGVENWWEM